MANHDARQPREARETRTPRKSGHPRDPYEDLPSVTNREWGKDRSDDAYTYGYPGQGGYGDFTDHQGRFAESQGRHAQSGHARGGVPQGGADRDERVSYGPLRTGHRGRGPKDYVRADDRIADDIVQRLSDDPHIDASEILVMVESGDVTLTGNVPERRMKHRAEDLVADASGVRDVHNRIRVDDGSRSAGRPGEAIRSGHDQIGSGFSSSERMDPVYDNPRDDSNWPGR
jgi:osmotically-inducible protein OsmY